MTDKLASICKDTNFRKLLESKGYAYFTKGCFNLNIIGIRSNQNNRVTNKFDDAIVVIYYDSEGKEHRIWFDITTEPGIYYVLNPCNTDGAAILAEGQHRGCWTIGYHQGKYEALVQNKPVKVYRDNNKDNIYNFEPSKLVTGVFGINIHKAGNASTRIDKWSAGCQVFANAKDFDKFMSLCHKQIDNGMGKNFTYTLINEKDITRK